MKSLFKYLIILIMILICSACIEPYDPDITGYEDILIIDGLLTDDPESSVIRLSRSFHYNEVIELPESGATVLIKDDLDNVTSLYEKSPGVYRSEDPGFRGIVGRSYQLFVITADGQNYNSDVVKLETKAPEIEKVYSEFGVNPGEKVMEYGFHIYLDSNYPDNSTLFYRYEFEETWEFAVPYPSKYEMVNGTLIPRLEDVHHCWKTIPSADILIVNNENTESNSIRKFPIHFVSANSGHLNIRYSILVRQYAMNRESYTFWNQLKESNNDRGTLFDSEPMHTIGNIYNTNNPELPVMGFFEATSMTTQRIFLIRSEIPPGIRVYDQFSDCGWYHRIIPLNQLDNYRGWCVVDYASTDRIMQGLSIIYTFMCCDCTQTGSNIRPDFW